MMRPYGHNEKQQKDENLQTTTLAKMITKTIKHKDHLTRGKLQATNLQEENPFTFECSHIFGGMIEKLLMCYQNSPVACTAVGCQQNST